MLAGKDQGEWEVAAVTNPNEHHAVARSIRLTMRIKHQLVGIVLEAELGDAQDLAPRASGLSALD